MCLVEHNQHVCFVLAKSFASPKPLTLNPFELQPFGVACCLWPAGLFVLTDFVAKLNPESISIHEPSRRQVHVQVHPFALANFVIACLIVCLLHSVFEISWCVKLSRHFCCSYSPLSVCATVVVAFCRATISLCRWWCWDRLMCVVVVRVFDLQSFYEMRYTVVVTKVCHGVEWDAMTYGAPTQITIESSECLDTR